MPRKDSQSRDPGSVISLRGIADQVSHAERPPGPGRARLPGVTAVTQLADQAPELCDRVRAHDGGERVPHEDQGHDGHDAGPEDHTPISRRGGERPPQQPELEGHPQAHEPQQSSLRVLEDADALALGDRIREHRQRRVVIEVVKRGEAGAESTQLLGDRRGVHRFGDVADVVGRGLRYLFERVDVRKQVGQRDVHPAGDVVLHRIQHGDDVVAGLGAEVHDLEALLALYERREQGDETFRGECTTDYFKMMDPHYVEPVPYP